MIDERAHGVVKRICGSRCSPGLRALGTRAEGKWIVRGHRLRAQGFAHPVAQPIARARSVAG